MSDASPVDPKAAALKWIVDLLQAHRVPFQIVGGLAARAYGATRELADIDIYIPADGFAKILPDVESRLTSRPVRHVDEHWDLVFMRLEHHGQPIELAASDDAQYRDATDGTWRNAEVNFGRSERRRVLGIEIPVMPLRELMDYKSRLRREVDLADIEELTRAGTECG